MNMKWIQSRQEKHDAFARLPRASREAAMRHVRQRKPFNELVTIDELIEAHTMIREANEGAAKGICTNSV